MAIYKLSELKEKLKVGDIVKNPKDKSSGCWELSETITGKITQITKDTFFINNCLHIFDRNDRFLEIVKSEEKSKEKEENLKQTNQPSESVATTHKKTSKMQKLTATFKRFTDKPTQTLFKAGFINGNLELTETGKDTLLLLALDAYKAKLVVLAQEAIDEEKEDKQIVSLSSPLFVGKGKGTI